MSSSFPARAPTSPSLPHPLLTVCFSFHHPGPSLHRGTPSELYRMGTGAWIQPANLGERSARFDQLIRGAWIWEQSANQDMTSDAAMMERVLPKNPDLETEEETYHTWHIENWRKLDRKLHGPVFKCGGYPWWVIFPGRSVPELT